MAATLLALVLADSVCRRIFLPLALLSGKKCLKKSIN